MSDDWGSAGDWGDSGNSTKKSDVTSSGGGSSWGNGATGGSSAKTSSGDDWASGGDSWGDSGGSSKKSGGNDAGSSWGASGGGGSWGASDIGSSDKPRGKGCFKCGQEGHMSRECPSGGGGGGSRGKGCFKCGEEGHMSRECPSGGGGGSRGKGCFKCGQEGHMSRECPSGGGGGGSRGKGCFKCGQEGHMSRECPSGGSSGGSRGKGCFKCGEEGHMSRECPSGGSGGGGSSFSSKKKGSDDWGSGGGGGSWGESVSPAQKKGKYESDGDKSSVSKETDDWGSGGGSWGDSGSSSKKKSSDDRGSSGGGFSSSAKKSSDDWGSGGGSWGESSSSKPSPKKSNGDWGSGGGGSWGESSSSTSAPKKSNDDWGSGGGGGGSWGDSGSSSQKKGNDDWGSGGGGGGGGGGKSFGGRDKPQGKGCFKCGEEGHMSRECPSGGGGGGSKGGKGCFKCGEDGHQAKDCSAPSLDADGKPRPPIYKPPDLNKDDKSLYESVATGENFDRYDSMPCSVSGLNVPKDPEKYETFEEAFTSTTIREGLAATKISKPTPIQKYGMRIVMAKRDLMACAQTGSGKTLAFILPILQDLYSDPNTGSEYGKMPQEPAAVIVSPTRELALQIYREAYKYSADSIVKVQIIYGGTSVSHQRAKLSEGVHILVGTPGRLLDFLNRGIFSFSNLKYFVLDEADRMIDSGFVPDVRKMVSHPSMPPKEKRQTLMFSATFPDAVQTVAAEFLKSDYLFLTVGILGAANADVEQTIEKVEKFSKRNKLLEILGTNKNNDRTMIFVEAKKTADFLASFLSQSDYRATSIHGDRYQHQREEALRDLKSGKFPILVATSVASRGLDIQGVRHVINYDLPKEIDDYVHRIGRTGRVGNKGKATSFYDPGQDSALAKPIVAIIKSANQEVPEWLNDEAEGNNKGYGGADFGGVDIRDGNYVDIDAPKDRSSISWSLDEPTKDSAIDDWNQPAPKKEHESSVKKQQNAVIDDWNSDPPKNDKIKIKDEVKDEHLVKQDSSIDDWNSDPPKIENDAPIGQMNESATGDWNEDPPKNHLEDASKDKVQENPKIKQDSTIDDWNSDPPKNEIKIKDEVKDEPLVKQDSSIDDWNSDPPKVENDASIGQMNDSSTDDWNQNPPKSQQEDESKDEVQENLETNQDPPADDWNQDASMGELNESTKDNENQSTEKKELQDELKDEIHDSQKKGEDASMDELDETSITVSNQDPSKDEQNESKSETLSPLNNEPNDEIHDSPKNDEDASMNELSETPIIDIDQNQPKDESKNETQYPSSIELTDKPVNPSQDEPKIDPEKASSDDQQDEPKNETNLTTIIERLQYSPINEPQEDLSKDEIHDTPKMEHADEAIESNQETPKEEKDEPKINEDAPEKDDQDSPKKEESQLVE